MFSSILMESFSKNPEISKFYFKIIIKKKKLLDYLSKKVDERKKKIVSIN